MPATRIEREAEQRGELLDEALGPLRVNGNQGRDRVERVEQEVRV